MAEKDDLVRLKERGMKRYCRVEIFLEADDWDSPREYPGIVEVKFRQDEKEHLLRVTVDWQSHMGVRVSAVESAEPWGGRPSAWTNVRTNAIGGEETKRGLR